MGLLAFLAKKIRNNFFDTTRKFQVNYDKHDPLQIAIKKSHTREDQTQTRFEQKTNTITQETLDNMDKDSLL